MTEQESKNLLNLPSKLKREISIKKYRAEMLQLNITYGSGGFVDCSELGTRVSGGAPKSRAEKISELEDMKKDIMEMIVKSEKVISKIDNLISNISLNHTPEPFESKYESISRENSETVLKKRFILGIEREDICSDMHIDCSTYFRYQSRGYDYFYEQVKNLNYKDFVLENKKI